MKLDEARGYYYVYQYKDHLGNIRLSYSDVNGDGSVNSSEIRREQNYYPFGLAHRGYNNVLTGVKNNLKTYQGQEFTDDLNLNIHEWKYRISDPTIGRFWQIDPLAEDYTYNSTYAFQENKMGMGVELEGAELLPFNPADLFNYEGGGKPVLTFGLHNIVLPTAERNESGGVGTFIENTAKAIYNGVADTWNAGMEGENMGDMAADGIAQMGDTMRRIESGEETVEDAENIVASAAMMVVRGKVNAKGKTPSLKKQATTIKDNLNGGKNSVTIRTSNGHTRYDLEGKAHGGIETPHKQSYKKNVDLNTGRTNVSRTSKKVESMNQQDVRTVRKTLEKRNQDN